MEWIFIESLTIDLRIFFVYFFHHPIIGPSFDHSNMEKKRRWPWGMVIVLNIDGSNKTWNHTFSKRNIFQLFVCSIVFPECVARVPVSLWGSGGWGCVRSTLRSRAQPSATVRNRPQPFARSPYGRAYGKFCRGGPFWRFQTCRCFVSRGRRGTSWHSDVFCNVSKVVLRGRRNTFATFSEDVLQFSWQAQHFGRVRRHFSWQAQHFRRVALRVFCKSHWQGCVKWRQGANSVAGVAFCAMCWKLTEASHETSILMLPIFGF